MAVLSYVSLFRAKRNYQAEAGYPSFLPPNKWGAHKGGPHCMPVEVSANRGSDGPSVRTAGQVTDAIRTVLNNTSLISVF